MPDEKKHAHDDVEMGDSLYPRREAVLEMCGAQEEPDMNEEVAASVIVDSSVHTGDASTDGASMDAQQGQEGDTDLPVLSTQRRHVVRPVAMSPETTMEPTSTIIEQALVGKDSPKPYSTDAVKEQPVRDLVLGVSTSLQRHNGPFPIGSNGYGVPSEPGAYPVGNTASVTTGSLDDEPGTYPMGNDASVTIGSLNDQPGAYPVGNNTSVTTGSLDDEPGAYPMGNDSSVVTGSLNGQPGVYPVGTNAIVPTTSSSDDEEFSDDDDHSTVQEPTLLEAVAVEDDRAQIEEHIRSQVFQEAVQADVLPPPNNWKIVLSGILLLVLALGLALGLGLGLGLSEDSLKKESAVNDESEEAPRNELPPAEIVDGRPTLEIIRERGFIRCGLAERYVHDGNGTIELIETIALQYCKAMALFAVGDPNKFEPVWASSSNRFTLLANKEIDVETFGSTYTMGRDVHERRSQLGFTFTTPYFYSGLTVAGNPFFVDCADALNSFTNGCRDLRICIEEGTIQDIILSEVLDGAVIVRSLDQGGSSPFAANLESGVCNAIAGEGPSLAQSKSFYDGEWKMGSRFFSKEPLALVTREDDPHWSTIVNLVLNTFILAEAHNISKENAHMMASLVEKGSVISASSLWGSHDGSNSTSNLAAHLVDLVSEFGHQGDIYDKIMESRVPRQQGLNTVYSNNKTSGLLYSFPFGKLDESGPVPVSNGTLDTVLQRGFLVCGVLPFKGPAFAAQNSTAGIQWSGFDAVFCQGLAASIFAGGKDKIVFVSMVDQMESYFALQNGTVDVVAGTRVTLQAEYHEPNTGQGFSFSTPYYYDNDSKDAFAFMTGKDDVQWSDWVNWIVMATIFAEEEGITSDTSVGMPVVTLFGEQLKQMFRDCISAVGSYAELYNNTIEPFIPRSGANRLNDGVSGPQMFPIPFS